MSATHEPLFVDKGRDAPRAGLPFVEREAVVAVVRNPKTRKYLGLRWRNGWETFVTGGVESGQAPEEAARREVHEETGYRNLRLIEILPRYHAQFYQAIKKENRSAHYYCFLFELENEEQDEVSEEERRLHECVWLTLEELDRFHLPKGMRFLLECVRV